MKIGLIADHSFPIPYKTHTGQICILDLAKALEQLGHHVFLFAPEGTQFDNLYPYLCSMGQYPPSSEECEEDCWNRYKDVLRDLHMVHDFSITKRVTLHLNDEGRTNTCSTLLGGPWLQQQPPHNLIVWSKAHRDRVLRGATDYENTPTPTLAGNGGFPVRDAHVVYGGVDTGFYTPDHYTKENYFLWMNRWHPAKGYKLAIDIAKATGINLVLAGEHPDNEMFKYQKQCAREAEMLSKDCPNIKIEWLPQDPDHHTAKRDLYRKAKALLYTVQFQEPFGLSQVEALACGTPVIGTNFGSVPELIHSKVGAVCGNSVESFAEAIKNIDRIDPVDCRKYASGNFDKRLFAKRCIEQYEKILRGENW